MSKINLKQPSQVAALVSWFCLFNSSDQSTDFNLLKGPQESFPRNQYKYSLRLSGIIVSPPPPPIVAWSKKNYKTLIFEHN